MNSSPDHPPENTPDPEIVRFGLSRAIQLHSEEYRARFPQVQLDLDLVEDENLLPQATCLALYQVYLERLGQLAGDPRAKLVSIHYYPSRSHMNLEIKDDGSGDGAQADTASLKACVEAAGGELLAAAQPGGGLKITAKAPLGG